MSHEPPGATAFIQHALFAVLEAADEGIVVFDGAGACRLVGRRLAELFGVAAGELVGRTRAEVLERLARACEEPEVLLALVASPHVARVVDDVDLRVPRPRRLVWTNVPIVQAGASLGAVGIVRDVTRERSAERSLRQLEARVADLTPVDTLTGLPNLRRFREELAREHRRSTRAWDSYAVLHLDVDGMGAINDELGVPVGDLVLERVAECLRASKREYDVAARHVSDAFLVLLPGADAVAARAVAQRMMYTVAEHAFNLADGRKITVSAGAAVWVPPSAEDAADIVERAGAALETARSMAPPHLYVDAATPSTRPPQPF